MTLPQIELRNVRHTKSLSQETPAYTAQVWVDGIHFADFSNHGTGGSDEVYQPKKTTPGLAVDFYVKLKELDRRIGAEFPKIDCSTFGGSGMMDRTLEIVCHELLEEIAFSKDLQRLLKRTVAFVDPAEKGVRSFKGNPVGIERAHLITETKRKRPAAVILNNLPFAEALAIYKAQAVS